MKLIEPVSSLSIARAVNLYTIILFLSFGVLLYWLATDRYDVFISSHEDKASNTTRIVAFEINKTLKEKKRLVDIFVENSRGPINELLNNPEEEIIYNSLGARIKKYLPDLFTFNILSQLGEPIIGDFNGDIGKLCMDDLKHYMKHGKQRIRLHPNHNVYHYDIVSEFLTNGAKQIFFASFEVNEISEMLKSAQSINHNLILINKEANNLIEITPQGGRKTISGRLDYRMNGDEYFRVLSTAKVGDTSWHVVDMRKEGLFSGYRNRIIIEYVIAFYVFSIIVLFMRHILIKQDEKRTTAENQLKKNHEQIQVLNDQLELLSKTDSLTGLYNRRYFDDIFNQEWNRALRSSNPLSCILFDVDYFKSYNDSYGHQAGDKCLKDISVLLKDSFRRAGDIVARYGGEEFIVIMADSSQDDAKAAISHFQRELEKLNILHEKSGVANYVTTSAGFVNQIPARDESIDRFIRMADEALYLAKAGGRNQWIMYDQ